MRYIKNVMTIIDVDPNDLWRCGSECQYFAKGTSTCRLYDEALETIDHNLTRTAECIQEFGMLLDLPKDVTLERYQDYE